jgi:SAM-dependent methyltransferase
MPSDPSEQWNDLGSSYQRLISDDSESSRYLREVGLKPTIVRLLGDCSELDVLDVGTGSGWLFETVRVGRAYACDFARSRCLPAFVNFETADAAALPWNDRSFDVIVSNLMLCYAEDIARPLAEMARVAKPGGRLVIGLVHPYFYRTGHANADGSVVVQSNLSEARSFEIDIGNRVGPFQYFYRPYPEYINSIIKSGWRITETSDWFMDRQRYLADFPDGGSVRRSERVPIFTFFSCCRN